MLLPMLKSSMVRSEAAATWGLSVLDHARYYADCLMARAERAWQGGMRRLESWRLARRYANCPRNEPPPATDYRTQTDRLAAIVQAHCGLGDSIVTAHASASIKLDAAEYAFSSMVEELRGVMTALPTTWMPDRIGETWPEPDPLPAADKQVAAA